MTSKKKKDLSRKLDLIGLLISTNLTGWHHSGQNPDVLESENKAR